MLERVSDHKVSKVYNAKFYEGQQEGSLTSARAVVPLVLDFVPAKSVCDVGCGVAPWLAVFRELGIHDVLGLDGDYVDTELLHIPADRFIPCDLTIPVKLDRRFDLAVSLEVAEHLPETRAAGFVHDLTALASVVLFSAAIPGQGGTNHINEQWQNYWARLFAAHDYVPVDVIRTAIWDNETVEWWYRQNIILYCAEKALGAYPKLAAAVSPKGVVRSDVHPALYRRYQPPGLCWLASKVLSKAVRGVRKGIRMALPHSRAVVGLVKLSAAFIKMKAGVVNLPWALSGRYTEASETKAFFWTPNVITSSRRERSGSWSARSMLARETAPGSLLQTRLGAGLQSSSASAPPSR